MNNRTHYEWCIVRWGHLLNLRRVYDRTINIETNVIIYINVFWYDNDDDICYSVFVFLSGIIRVRRNDG